MSVPVHTAFRRSPVPPARLGALALACVLGLLGGCTERAQVTGLPLTQLEPSPQGVRATGRHERTKSWGYRLSNRRQLPIPQAAIRLGPHGATITSLGITVSQDDEKTGATNSEVSASLSYLNATTRGAPQVVRFIAKDKDNHVVAAPDADGLIAKIELPTWRCHYVATTVTSAPITAPANGLDRIDSVWVEIEPMKSPVSCTP